MLFLLFLNVPLSAQTNAPRNLSSRYLFIVDSSAAMRRCAPAVQKAVGNLLRSSLSTQLRPGDTVGVWTFDEQLYAGRFPLQRWSPELAETVASNVVAFLRTQSFQKQSRYEVVAPALAQIVKDSYQLTVLLVTDGDENVAGTPFDREIQTALRQNFKTQQKARMPFITVLRARRGQIVNASVNLVPWPVELPAFPPEPEIVEAPKPKPPEKKPMPRPTVPSLIVIGEKPVPPPATNAPAATHTNLEASAPAANNSPSTVETANPRVTLTPTPLSPGENKPATATIPLPAPGEVATKEATPTTTSPDPNSPPIAPAVAPTPTEAIKPPPVSVVETKPAPLSASTLPGEPIKSPPSTPPAEPGPVIHSAKAPLSVESSSPTAARLPTNPPAPIALAVQPEPGFSRLGMVAIGGAIVLLAGGLFFVLQRRARQAAHPSLITRSLDRGPK